MNGLNILGLARKYAAGGVGTTLNDVKDGFYPEGNNPATPKAPPIKPMPARQSFAPGANTRGKSVTAPRRPTEYNADEIQEGGLGTPSPVSSTANNIDRATVGPGGKIIHDNIQNNGKGGYNTMAEDTPVIKDYTNLPAGVEPNEQMVNNVTNNGGVIMREPASIIHNVRKMDYNPPANGQVNNSAANQYVANARQIQLASNNTQAPAQQTPINEQAIPVPEAQQTTGEQPASSFFKPDPLDGATFGARDNRPTQVSGRDYTQPFTVNPDIPEEDKAQVNALTNQIDGYQQDIDRSNRIINSPGLVNPADAMNTPDDQREQNNAIANNSYPKRNHSFSDAILGQRDEAWKAQQAKSIKAQQDKNQQITPGAITPLKTPEDKKVDTLNTVVSTASHEAAQGKGVEKTETSSDPSTPAAGTAVQEPAATTVPEAQVSDTQQDIPTTPDDTQQIQNAGMQSPAPKRDWREMAKQLYFKNNPSPQYAPPTPDDTQQIQSAGMQNNPGEAQPAQPAVATAAAAPVVNNTEVSQMAGGKFNGQQVTVAPQFSQLPEGKRADISGLMRAFGLRKQGDNTPPTPAEFNRVMTSMNNLTTGEGDRPFDKLNASGIAQSDPELYKRLRDRTYLNHHRLHSNFYRNLSNTQSNNTDNYDMSEVSDDMTPQQKQYNIDHAKAKWYKNYAPWWMKRILNTNEGAVEDFNHTGLKGPQRAIKSGSDLSSNTKPDPVFIALAAKKIARSYGPALSERDAVLKNLVSYMRKKKAMARLGFGGWAN